MELTLVRENGDVLCQRCEIADSSFARTKGLLGRSSLPDDEGMLLATGAIHTSFMRFPIDVAFLDKNFIVQRTIDSLKPWRIAWERRAHAVVELSSGALQRVGVREGEQVSLVRHARVLDGTAANQPDADAAVRVAVASTDSRFLRVAGFLLARQSFDVETFREARELMKSDRPSDVVVLDSSTSLVTAARVMRELSVVSPSTGFVVVGDSSANGAETEAHGTQTLRVLPKWESFDRLVDEILVASQSGRSRSIA
jgi:uncharacterized protein